MMRFSIAASALAALAFAHSATAGITGMTASTDSVAAGDNIAVTFSTTGSATNNEQDYVIFGLVPEGQKIYPNTIGSQAQARADISSYNTNNYREPVQIEVKIPEGTESGSKVLTSAVFGQVGASGGITVQYFNATITVS